VLQHSLLYAVTELNWKCLLQQNSGTREEIGRSFLQPWFAAGFRAHEGSLMGPAWPEQDTEALLPRMLAVQRSANIFFSKGAHAIEQGPLRCSEVQV
jgi:hypothetical protein